MTKGEWSVEQRRKEFCGGSSRSRLFLPQIGRPACLPVLLDQTLRWMTDELTNLKQSATDECEHREKF